MTDASHPVRAGRKAAYGLSVSAFLGVEIELRGWSERDVELQLFAAGGEPVDVVAAQFGLYVDDKCLILDAETAALLGKTFDIDPSILIAMNTAWRASARKPWCAPRVILQTEALHR